MKAQLWNKDIVGLNIPYGYYAIWDKTENCWFTIQNDITLLRKIVIEADTMIYGPLPIPNFGENK